MSERPLIHHTGWAYFPVAFVARLPFAMMIVGVLTLVATVTESIGLAGFTSAATGVGVVIAGPVIGDLVDRFGQRRVLLPLGLAGGILLALFPVVVFADVPDGMLLAMAFLLGLTAPQTAALSRTRMMALTGAYYRGHRLARTTSRVMAYESAADETAFVFGPVLVGLLATFVAPWAPIAAAAAVSLVFVTAFALHPTARVAPTGDAEGEVRAPIGAVLSPGVIVVVGGAFGVGLVFGSTLTSLTAFAQHFGEGDQAGLLYGLVGIGSAVLALAVMLLPERFSLRTRWLVFATVLILGTAAYAMVADLHAATVVLLAMGLGIGPTLVTLFSLAGRRSPVGRTATTMTVVGAALTLAQALSSAVTGQVAAISLRAAMMLPVISAALILTLGVVNVLFERRGR